VTARSRGFTELLYLDQLNFFEVINSRYAHIATRYENLRYQFQQSPGNLCPLFVRCYWCEGKGHVATSCKFFGDIRGNMRWRKDPSREGPI
jgi:hypothetical protein